MMPKPLISLLRVCFLLNAVKLSLDKKTDIYMRERDGEMIIIQAKGEREREIDRGRDTRGLA